MLTFCCPAASANIFVGYGMLMKIGDLGMSRHVYPSPAEASTTTAPSSSHLTSTTCLSLGSRHSGHSSNGSTPHAARHGSVGGVPHRTLTPGVVGTMAYAAPELVDEQLQISRAAPERLLKVRRKHLIQSTILSFRYSIMSSYRDYVPP
jgi:serine/threonine protein kinase